MNPATDRFDAFRNPHSAGALFFGLLLLLGGCKEKEPTPEWKDTPAPAAAETPAEATPAENPAEPSAETGTTAPAETEPAPPTPAAKSDPKRLRFVSYNVENYLTMSRYQDGKAINTFKADREIAAIVKLITGANPDVFGVCEIGTYDDLVHLQTKLKEAGLDMPHIEHTGGADETRHLGLLSKLPIASRNTPLDLTYSLQGKEFTMSRGILDVAIGADGQEIRFVGVHLKSKREIPDADQELMRRNEAYVFRKHVDTIFAAKPDALVVAYGDFNDTRRNTAIRSAQGAYNSPGFLEAVHLTDSRGEVWTHYWDYQHVYSRFDYILVSKAMRKLVEHKECRILDDPAWKDASDHRPLLAVFGW